MRFLNTLIAGIYRFFFYRSLSVRNTFRELFREHVHPTYLFILAPPFSGSTLLAELLSTSAHVSINNPLGTREGQQLPALKKLLWEVSSELKYDPHTDYNWPFIRTVWHRYWDPTRSILLEKSPPNIARALQIQRHFSPVYFVCMVRNPYAQCEGHIRRGSLNSEPEAIARFVIHCMRLQKKNMESLSNILFFTYEDLTDHTDNVKETLTAFLPALADINIGRIFTAHNALKKPMPISNQNARQINALSDTQIRQINKVFEQNMEIMDYFRYPIIAPGSVSSLDIA